MRKTTLLAVDDIPQNLRYVQALVSKHLPECEVLVAERGEAALALVQDNSVDCALLDVRMPDMDGIELCRRLKAAEPSKRFPIILITGHDTTTEFRAQSLEAGAEDFVSRPIDNVELVARLKVMLRIKLAEDELRQANAQLEQRIEERTAALRATLAKREELERIINHSPAVAFCWHDTQDRRVEYVSENVREFGYGPEDLVGGRFRYMDLVHPEDRERVRAQLFRKTQGNGHSSALEYRLSTGDGETRWVEERTWKQPGDGALWQGVVIDITQRKEAQRALAESEELHRITLGSISDAVFLAKDDGQLTFICPNVTLIFGYTYEEAARIGRIDPLLGEGLFDPGELAQRGELRNIEWTVRDKSGARHDVLINVKRVSIHGATLLYTCRDVTERREAQRAMQESEERFHAVFDQASDAIFLVELNGDRLGRFIEANRTACERLGYGLEEFRSMTPDDVRRPGDPVPVPDVLASLDSTQGHTYETVHVARDGSEIPVEVSVSLLRFGEKEVAMAIVRDITERKRLEEEARLRQQQLVQVDKMVSLGILVSGVAHEINNPNHLITSNVAPLENVYQGILPIADRYCRENGDFSIDGTAFSVLRERVPVMFRHIAEGSKRIKLIVDELRDYARETRPDVKDTVQVNEVARSSLTLLHNMIKNSTDRFTTDLDPDVPLVEGNYQRLEQVVINLLQNACQALTSPGQPVTLASRYDSERGRVELVVADGGGGISEENLPHVTDPFFTTKRERGGSGLGLAIVSSIVDEHGGVLRLESERGQGTTVTVSIPVAAGAEAKDETGGTDQ